MSVPVRRWLFVAAILSGSFLLFLVQPLIARMALPRLGGAPNVWNSAMLVYQALLLAGYAYAHWLGRFAIRRQATIHIGVLLAAALTLPLGLVSLSPPASGQEALWVPLLFALSIGPVFFAISAQAPLLQRWFVAHPAASEPWPLYAASNLGSFAGLIAFPLLVEPLLPLAVQSIGWTIAYAVLVGLVALCAWARWKVGSDSPLPFRGAAGSVVSPPGETSASEDTPHPKPSPEVEGLEAIPARTILLWLALAAVPSGLMLSTTTHLTTDIFAMPLLWVIPLGLYLLSFVVAFSDKRELATVLSRSTPLIMLLAGGIAMSSHGTSALAPVIASVILLFLVCVALHSRMYELRPAPSRLTLFYLVMSLGGALGGLFTALIAPLVFDWTWEHPLLVLAAAALLPLPALFDWRARGEFDREPALAGAVVITLAAIGMAWLLKDVAPKPDETLARLALTAGIAICGMLLIPWRLLYLLALVLLMLSQGGYDTVQTSLDGLRQRSYFGIYTLRDYPGGLRMLSHGTTLHGQQSNRREQRLVPSSYYGPTSGVALALTKATQLYGPAARVGIVGLGTGTLACYRKPGQSWTFFEIDPLVLEYSRNGAFTYLRDCAPDANVVLGDARLEIAKLPADTIDVLVVDAFSSDAIPLHLLTREAFAVYDRVVSPQGALLVHISNRYIELEPVVAANARSLGLSAMIRDDNPQDRTLFSASSWVLLTRDQGTMIAAQTSSADASWDLLDPPAPRPWRDDFASILPYIRWDNLLGRP
jgi:SAM-dependent methyltransferase